MRTLIFCGSLAFLCCNVQVIRAAIVFETFNTNEGRFSLAPTFSGSNSNIATTSTADRVTSPNPVFEGVGSERVVVNMTTDGLTSRLRFLSGAGSPAGGSGSPANTTFNLSGGVDGFIGFYLLSPVTNTSSWNVTLSLDGPNATAAEMSQGVPLNIVNDGVWRLYEWDLDNALRWQAVAGISGNATLEDGQASIDSIIFRSTSGQNSTFYIDFIAKSDSGSIAALVPVPEPGSLLTCSLGAIVGMVYHRRRVRANCTPRALPQRDSF